MKGNVSEEDYEPTNIKGTAKFTLTGSDLTTDVPLPAIIPRDDYIRLNAIGNRSVGDQFLITGTTSLPAGTGLIWQIMPYSGTVPTGLDLTATTGIMANTPVTKWDGTANRVSLAVDMENQEPGDYVVIVGAMKGDPVNREIAIGDPVGSARFTLK
jgi:hypothetical protein